MSEPFWVPLGNAPAPLDAGPEVAYGEATANVSITATTEATAQAVATAPPFTADGTSQYLVEFQALDVQVPGGSSSFMYFALFLDGVSLGTIAVARSTGATGTEQPLRVARRLTPAAGARVFSVRAYVSTGTGVVVAGAGGAGVLLPSFLRVSKVPTAVAGPGALVPPLTVVTALPASPVDGQEIVLVDSLTAPTFAWHLRYFAARASNRWVAIGGEAVSWVPTQEARGTAATYAALTTPGPQVTVPVAGIYTVELSVVLVANGGWSQWMSYAIGATAAVDTDAVSDAPQSDIARSRLDYKTLAAGSALVAQYRSDGSHTATFRNRLMRVTPVALGG